MMLRRRLLVFVFIPPAINWIHRVGRMGCGVNRVATRVKRFSLFFAHTYKAASKTLREG
jgi:hypothetical protein